MSPSPRERETSIKAIARVTPIFVDGYFLKIVLPKVAGPVLPRHLCVLSRDFFFYILSNLDIYAVSGFQEMSSLLLYNQ